MSLTAILPALRYSLLNVMICAFIAALVAGGDWIWIAYLAALVFGSGFDEGIGDGNQNLTAASRWIYNFNLYAAAPLIAVLALVYLQNLTSSDPLGLVHALSALGIDFKPAIEYQNPGRLLGATFGAGYFFALGGMTVGHELAHRVSLPARVSSRILLAFTLNTSFAIAHVHGHHRNVATHRDPGSARRGEYSLAFAVRSTVGQHIEAFEIEADRLRRKELSVWSWQNRALRDQLYPLTLLGIAFLIAGYPGVIGMTVAGIFGSLIQKLVDYCQHYGLVRVDGRRVEERHSWDCYRFLSNAIQFNLPLHAHHHKAARAPFWELRPIDGAPRLPVGYQTAAWLSLFPPLWRRIINPLLAEWDERMANDEERELIRQRGWQIEPPRGKMLYSGRT